MIAKEIGCGKMQISHFVGVGGGQPARLEICE